MATRDAFHWKVVLGFAQATGSYWVEGQTRTRSRGFYGIRRDLLTWLRGSVGRDNYHYVYLFEDELAIGYEFSFRRESDAVHFKLKFG